MRILHTADWHLGHRLYNRDRTPEHRGALAWLLQTVKSERADLVILAGDVFDVTNPSNQAKELYYEFLAGLVRTDCAAAVIVGGNHDSPSLLDAPRGLLRQLSLHVVGAAGSPPADRVFRIDCGDQSVVVAAVPYLRERDLRTSQFGESSTERLDRLRQSIRDHFSDIAGAAMAARGDTTLPMIVTGHLFAAGASDDDEKKSYIYQADENNIQAQHFPSCFDYVALGHVHRAQHVGEHDHIRYAGSLVPLTFVEGQRARSVCLVELGAAGETVNVQKIRVPTQRKLVRLHAPLPEVKQELARAVREAAGETLRPWVEVRVLSDDPVPNLREKLLEVILDTQGTTDEPPAVELLRISTERLTPRPDTRSSASLRQLEELRPPDVFDQLCDRQAFSGQHRTEIQGDFADLYNWVEEQEEL
ncbi:exonuclease SbcCD subunit D C-terminal domain-containing protein [Lewinella sp. IMCC34191]|uniref:exonuclease SbcCD subunit D C-terminal domain-containing protein n=1 Tax=Lewinella sp. IMCC34191 TaxID=2259172 RepID=UPI000E27FFBF|nr:exonuclease SbcCD subunit D C-terminal domain-containing protein [Lewinella sp. IMCC34191]